MTTVEVLGDRPGNKVVVVRRDDDSAVRGHKDEEELRRLEAIRRDATDDRARAQQLMALAHDADFETEASRQAYLALAATLGDERLRYEALKALLVGAPISVETGRGALTLAQRFGADGERLALLHLMHQLSESDLVRGPLVDDYLKVAEGLQGEAALAKALRELLHPNEVPTGAVERALTLLRRVQAADLRASVLREVTDHQQLTGPVEGAYQALVAAFPPRLAAQAAQRLDEARADRAGPREWASAGEQPSGDQGWSFTWQWPSGERARREVERAKLLARAEAERARELARAEAERAKEEARRVRDEARESWRTQLEAQREALRQSQAQLKERARELEARAREYWEQAKRKAPPQPSTPPTDEDDPPDLDLDLDFGEQ